MSALSSPLLLSTIERVGWGIVNSFWIGAITAIALALTLRVLRNAAGRHIACMLALVVTVGATVAVTAKVAPMAKPHPRAAGSTASSAGTFPDPELWRSPVGAVATDAPLPERIPIKSGPPFRSGVSQSHVAAAPLSAQQWQQLIAPALPWLSVSWLIGVILLSLRHCGGWWRVRSWRRTGKGLVHAASQRLASEISRKLGLRRLVPIMESLDVLTPMLAGTVRPIILLPLRVVTGFSAGELEAILAHELAHLARGDAWANLLQLICETLLFYHPAVWWMSRQTRIERENAADDLATAVCADRLQYANALARLAEHSAEPRLVLAANDGTLLARIRRLVLPTPRASTATSAWAAGGLVLGGLLCIALLLILRTATADEALTKEAIVASGKSISDASGASVPPSSTNQLVAKTPEELARKATEDAKSWIDDAFQLEDKAKREAAIERIRGAMMSGTADETRAGATAFVRLGAIEFDKASFRPTVRALLGSADVPTRAAAATALTMTGADAEDVERILKLADDPAPEVRQHLSWIIFQLHKGDLTGRGGDAVLKLLASTDRNELREALRGIWGAQFSPGLEARVIELSQNLEGASSLPYDAMYFALSTQANKSEASVKRLIQLLSHQDTTNIAGRSAWGLQQGVDRAQFSLVADAMAQVIEARSDGYLRNNALRCLRTYGDARQAPALKALLAKPGVTGELRKLLEETHASLEKRRAETGNQSATAPAPLDNTVSTPGTKAIAAPVSLPQPSAAATEKAEIEVEWEGKWWPARILKKEGDRTLIHYVGYGSEWDESVPPERIRPLQSKDVAIKTPASGAGEEKADATRVAQLVEQNRRAARLRAAEDRRHYSPEQLQEIETLYQVANTKGKRTAEAKASLKQLLEKYDKANRTGCATLYLGQASEGAERLEYLTRAVEKFSDCYYFNGCQVGGYGRYVLALTLWEKGEKEKARALLAELKTTYKDATDHRGRPIGEIVEAAEKELAKQQ